MKMGFRRAIVTLVLVVTSSTAIGVQGPVAAQDDGVAWVRWVNGYGGTLTLTINESPDALPTLSFGEASDYAVLTVGDHRLELADESGAVAEQTLALDAGMAVTIVVVESDDEIGILIFQDELSPLMPGSARLNLLHASPDAPELALALPDETLLMTDVAYGSLGSIELATGRYPIAIVDATKPDVPVLDPPEFDFRTGMAYDLIVIGSVLGEPNVTSLLLSTPVAPGEDERLVRFVHAVPGASALDVYLDGTLMLPGLEPGEITPYFPFPAREVTIRCNESDRALGEPVVTGSVEPEMAQGTTFVVRAEGIINLADDLSAPPPGKTRLTVLNAMADGQISLILPDGGILIGDVAPSEAESIELFIADYEIEVAWNGAELIESFNMHLAGGHLYTLVINIAPDIRATMSEVVPWEQLVSLVAGAGITISEAGFPIATVNVPEGANLLLRQGPGQEYDFLARIPRGEELTVLGRDATGAWLYVRYPDPESEEPSEGWVATEWVILTLDGESLSVREVPVAE